MSIVKARKRIVRNNKMLIFKKNDDSNDGEQWGFECDENWRPILESFFQQQLFAELVRKEEQGLLVRENREWNDSFFDPGIMKCNKCENHFDYDDPWSNTCPHCGADYDGNGNLLAPRRFWGEETGERF